MSDAQEIASLVSQPIADDGFTSYSESSYAYISDISNNDYNSNTITFTTDNIKSYWSVLSDSYLLLPLNIKSNSGTALITASAIGFKQSILDMITGIQIQTTSGQPLVSETRCDIPNNLRLLIDHDKTWYDSGEASELFFVKNKRDVRADLSAGNSFATQVNATNAGLKERISLLKDRCVFLGGVFKTVAKIPLKYLHPFFNQADNPFINFPLNITLTFNPYCMFGEGLAPADQAVISIGSAQIAGSSLTLNSGRLYYKSVKFSPQANEKITALLKSGFTKEIVFSSYDVVQPINGQDNAQDEGKSCTKLISQGVVCPTRLYCLAPVATAFNNSTPTVLPLYHGAFVGNVLINNEQWLKNGMSSSIEWYKELKSVFPNAGSDVGVGGLISYSDFLSDYRIHCLDLTRMSASRLSDPNASVSITAQLTRDVTLPVAGSCDHWFVIERKNKVSVSMSSAGVHVVVGVNA